MAIRCHKGNVDYGTPWELEDVSGTAGKLSASCFEVQAVLAINFLGPSTAARARSNRFLRACCSTYTTTSHFLSLKAQKCDPTCPSPATGRSDTHPGPGNTTRQIRTLRRGGHVPNAPPVRVLTGQPLTSCVRARSAPLTCPAAPERLLPLR